MRDLGDPSDIGSSIAYAINERGQVAGSAQRVSSGEWWERAFLWDPQGGMRDLGYLFGPQPQSVAHGLNLQGTAATVIWHSLTWNLEDYQQFIRRVWRQGQKEKVIVHHIVAKDTVDEAVMLAIAGKDQTQKALLGALSTYVGVRRGR